MICLCFPLFISLFISSGQTLDALLLELTAFSWRIGKIFWFEENYFFEEEKPFFAVQTSCSFSFLALKYFSEQNNPWKFIWCPSVSWWKGLDLLRVGDENSFWEKLFCWIEIFLSVKHLGLVARKSFFSHSVPRLNLALMTFLQAQI